MLNTSWDAEAIENQLQRVRERIEQRRQADEEFRKNYFTFQNETRGMSSDRVGKQIELLKSSALAATNNHYQPAMIATSGQSQLPLGYFSSPPPPPPPPPPDAPDWLKKLLDWIGQHSIRHGQLKPPAYACYSASSKGKKCFPDTGLLKVRLQDTGSGWGWGAGVSKPPDMQELIFIYLPPIEGILSVSANLHFRGAIMALVDTHFWSRTFARFLLSAICSLHQNLNDSYYQESYWGADPLKSNYFLSLDDTYSARCTMYVVPNDPVFIRVGPVADGYAHSKYASIDVDFSSPLPEKYVLVESIDVSLDPAP